MSEELCGICDKPLVDETYADDDELGGYSHERCIELRDGGYDDEEDDDE
jgi:hypothetical protein